MYTAETNQSLPVNLFQPQHERGEVNQAYFQPGLLQEDVTGIKIVLVAGVEPDLTM